MKAEQGKQENLLSERVQQNLSGGKMKLNNLLLVALIGTMISFLNFSYASVSFEKPKQAAKKTEKNQKKEEVPVEEKIFIAPEAAKIFDEDAALRKTRNDIPLHFLRTVFLPAQQNNLYSVFWFKIKNADLGFTAPTEEAETLSTQMHVFIRFYNIENGNLKGIFREVYIPFRAQESREGYNPEEENLYTFGYILPPGEYLLASAFTSNDLTKIVTIYSEFSLPDTASLQGKIETTPVLSVKSIQQVDTPETKLKIYKNYFTYGRLIIEPKIENVFRAGENVDLFYFILGAKTHPETQRQDLEIKYSIKKGTQGVVRFPPQPAKMPIVSQPIPLISKGKNLEAGNYTIVIEILDKISNISVTKEVALEIK